MPGIATVTELPGRVRRRPQVGIDPTSPGSRALTRAAALAELDRTVTAVAHRRALASIAAAQRRRARREGDR